MWEEQYSDGKQRIVQKIGCKSKETLKEDSKFPEWKRYDDWHYQVHKSILRPMRKSSNEHIWTSTFEPQMFNSGTDCYERQNSQCNQIFTFIIKWLACNDSSLTSFTNSQIDCYIPFFYNHCWQGVDTSSHCSRPWSMLLDNLLQISPSDFSLQQQFGFFITFSVSGTWLHSSFLYSYFSSSHLD